MMKMPSLSARLARILHPLRPVLPHRHSPQPSGSPPSQKHMGKPVLCRGFPMSMCRNAVNCSRPVHTIALLQQPCSAGQRAEEASPACRLKPCPPGAAPTA